MGFFVENILNYGTGEEDIQSSLERLTVSRHLRDTLLQRNDGAIVSTPKKVSLQKDVFDNKYEIHKSQWNKDELSSFGTSFFLSDPVSHIGYLSLDKRQVDALKSEFFMRKIRRLPAMDFVMKSSRRLASKYNKIA